MGKPQPLPHYRLSQGFKWYPSFPVLLRMLDSPCPQLQPLLLLVAYPMAWHTHSGTVWGHGHHVLLNVTAAFVHLLSGWGKGTPRECQTFLLTPTEQLPFPWWEIITPNRMVTPLLLAWWSLGTRCPKHPGNNCRVFEWVSPCVPLKVFSFDNQDL